jgi:serine/threonine-protein kinase
MDRTTFRAVRALRTRHASRPFGALALALAVVALATLPLAGGCTTKTPKPEEEGPPLENPADTIVVPDVIGMEQIQAASALGALGFGVAADEVFSDTVAEGMVIAQSLDPGTAVAPETEIVLTVSKGPELVEVPKVIGMYPDDAEAVLASVGLQMNAVDVHGPIDPDAGNADIGEVYRQTPSAGSMVPKGTVIEVRSWWESG